MAVLTRLNPSTLPETEAIGYSQISIANSGRLAFVSGQVATDRDGSAIPASLVGQTEMVIKNLSGALQALGATPRDIVQMRIYAVDMSPAGVQAAMVKLGEFLDGAKPSLTGIGVNALASPDYLVEIEMVVQLEPVE